MEQDVRETWRLLFLFVYTIIFSYVIIWLIYTEMEEFL